MSVDLYPTVCNLCGGEVEYIPNSKIYGKSYGSGYCYHCKNCGAYVGTNKMRPKQALGILANKEMRELKMKCHDEFDKSWKYSSDPRSERSRAYERFAKKMGIDVSECHFGYFNTEQLNKALGILKNG